MKSEPPSQPPAHLNSLFTKARQPNPAPLSICSAGTSWKSRMKSGHPSQFPAYLNSLFTKATQPSPAPLSKCSAVLLNCFVKAATRAVSRLLPWSSSICWATLSSSTAAGWLCPTVLPLWLLEASDAASAQHGTLCTLWSYRFRLNSSTAAGWLCPTVLPLWLLEASDAASAQHGNEDWKRLHMLGVALLQMCPGLCPGQEASAERHSTAALQLAGCALL